MNYLHETDFQEFYFAVSSLDNTIWQESIIFAFYSPKKPANWNKKTSRLETHMLILLTNFIIKGGKRPNPIIC